MSTDDLDNIDFKNTTPKNVQRVQKMMSECIRHRGGPVPKSEYLKKLKEKREIFYSNKEIWDFLYSNNGVDLRMAQYAWSIGPKKSWEVLQGVEKNPDIYSQVAKEYRSKLISYSLEYENLFFEKIEKFEKIEEYVENIARNVMDESKNSKRDIEIFSENDWRCCHNLIQSYMYKKEFISDYFFTQMLEEALTENVMFDSQKQCGRYIEKIIKSYLTSGADLNNLDNQEKNINVLEIVFEVFSPNQETLYNLFKMGIQWDVSRIWGLSKQEEETGNAAWGEYQTVVQKNTIAHAIEDQTQTKPVSVRKI